MMKTIKAITLVSMAVLTPTALVGCKSTGKKNLAHVQALETASNDRIVGPNHELPSIATLIAARARAIAAVTNAGGKDPVLVYINIYPSGMARCTANTTVEFGISYNTSNADDQARAAGFYVKPDSDNACSAKDDLLMDAARALDAFLGMRPIDESGFMDASIKIEPAALLKKEIAGIKIEDSLKTAKAWNLFLKTILGPSTIDSLQYQIEMLCRDDTAAGAIFSATDGTAIHTERCANE